jgi:hypothetical protein
MRMGNFRHLAAAAILLVAAGASSEGAAQCVSRGEGQRMVAEGQVNPLPVALQQAGLGDIQVLPPVNLCQSGRGWYYEVRYRYGGQVSAVSIPAGGGGGGGARPRY